MIEEAPESQPSQDVVDVYYVMFFDGVEKCGLHLDDVSLQQYGVTLLVLICRISYNVTHAVGSVQKKLLQNDPKCHLD